MLNSLFGLKAIAPHPLTEWSILGYPKLDVNNRQKIEGPQLATNYSPLWTPSEYVFASPSKLAKVSSPFREAIYNVPFNAHQDWLRNPFRNAYRNASNITLRTALRYSFRNKQRDISYFVLRYALHNAPCNALSNALQGGKMNFLFSKKMDIIAYD